MAEIITPISHFKDSDSYVIELTYLGYRTCVLSSDFLTPRIGLGLKYEYTTFIAVSQMHLNNTFNSTYGSLS
jgi:hypothetical protein